MNVFLPHGFDAHVEEMGDGRLAVVVRQPARALKFAMIADSADQVQAAINYLANDIMTTHAQELPDVFADRPAPRDVRPS